MMKTGCAVGEEAMCSGSPNSRIARGGLKRGMAPPRVKAVAMRRGGMWRGRKGAMVGVLSECEQMNKVWRAG